MNLNGARILITGGGTGIGRSLTERLTQRSAQVAICGRRETPLREVAEATGAHPFVCDVGDEAQVRSTVARAREALGGLDVLINNAGFRLSRAAARAGRGARCGGLVDHVKGAMLCAREAARGFVTDGGGTIVNVGLDGGGQGLPRGLGLRLEQVRAQRAHRVLAGRAARARSARDAGRSERGGHPVRRPRRSLREPQQAARRGRSAAGRVPPVPG